MKNPPEKITGLAYDPSDPQFDSNPSNYYRWLRDEQPVHQHAASGSILLSRFQDVLDAASDPVTFSSASPVSKLQHMASMDPPEHDRLRSSVAAWFTPGKIAGFESLVRSTCQELLESLRDTPRVELVAAFSALFPSRVIHRILGVPQSLDEPLRVAALAIGGAQDSRALAQQMAAFESVTHRVIADQGSTEGAGLIQALQRAMGKDSLGHNQIRGICSNLVLAGTDTVTNLIGNGLVLLQRHPASRDALVEDPSRIPSAVEEMLRLESPVQSLARRSTKDLVLHGVEIPAGSEIRLMWGAANRDDRVFERPDSFDIARANNRHLALGHGIHFCLGAGLARLEAQIAFEEILSTWPHYRIDETRLERLPSLWVRAWKRLDLRPG